MIHFETFLPFLLSLALGAFLGLERAFTHKASTMKKTRDDLLGGVRTYALISLLGTIASYIDNHFIPGIALMSFGGIVLLTGISYFISYNKMNERGITTEVSLLVCFVIGVIIEKNQYVLGTFITVLAVVVLYFREYLDRVTERVEASDISAVIKFGIITFVILPFFDPKHALYIKDFGPGLFAGNDVLRNLEVINLHTVWLMVVLISGIGFTGYLAIKILGSRKGIGLTGFLGGLVSSTATTITFSKRSKEDIALSVSAALAVLLACSTMFPRILVEVLIINSALLPALSIMMGSMALGGFTFCFFLWKRSGSEKSDEVPLSNPFNILPAVKFGLLYALIVFIARFVGERAGESGVYIVSILSGLTDVDAITLTLSQISKKDPTKLNQATIAITLAAFSNTILKASMASLMGSVLFRRNIIIGFTTILLSGIAGLVLYGIFF